MADETLKVNTIRGMLYTVQPTASGTITRESDGKIILGFSANEQATFTGPGGYVICSDKTADIIENFKGALAIGAATGGSSGGEGGGITPAQEALLNGAAQKTAVNVFTMGNTFEGSVDFTGAVDLSEATVTFPADLELPGGEDGVSCTHSWNGTELIIASASGISSADLKGEKGDTGPAGPQGPQGEKGDTGLTDAQIATLTTYASAEGQNITPSGDGSFATQVGHTYVVTAGASAVTVTAGSELSFEVSANAQRGFVATTTTATVSSTNCVVTEVFKPAAPIELSSVSSGGGGGGEPTDTTNTLKYTFSGSYYSIEGDLSGMPNGTYAFRGQTLLSAFKADLSSMTTGAHMFNGCSNMTSFEGNMPLLTSADSMFYDCKKLATYTAYAPKLRDISSMFRSCAITSFDGGSAKITSGIMAFTACSNLSSITADFSELSNGYFMFDGCSRLTAFENDLSSLTNGDTMFRNCIRLTTFNSNLSSLNNAGNMFGSSSSNCTKLNLASVQNIAATINTVSGKTIPIGIDPSLQSDDETAPINVALAAIRAKGWTVTELYQA